MLNKIKMRTALGLSAIAALCFWNCNVSETPDSSILRMSLPDSLATENGLYDSVVVDLYDTNNVKTHSGVFSESYEIAEDKEKLANIKLATKAPFPLIIRITAYKNNVSLLLLRISLSDNGRVELPITLLNRVDTSGTVVQPSTIAISNPFPLVLFVGDAPTTLSAAIQPLGTPGEIIWKLPATDAAVIMEGNKIKGLAPGTVVVTASLAGRPEVFSTLEVEVQSAPSTPPQSVVIANPAPVTLVIGGSSVPLQASVLPPQALPTVAWSLPPTDIAVIEGGNLIRGLKVGTILATAASTADPSVKSTIEVKVLEAVANPPTSLTIANASPLALNVGTAVILQALVGPEGSSPDVVWRMESAGIAEIVNNNQVRGLKAGSAKVIATSAVKSDLTDTLLVQVVALVVNPASVTLNMPTPLTLAVTDSPVALSATVLPAGADTTVIWTSSDPLVAEITPDSKVKPLKAGKATLTAKSGADPAVFATLSVEVIVPVKVDAISVSPKKMTLYTGGSDSLVTVTMTGTKIDSAKYNLASSAPLIVSVLANGAVKGLKAGEAIITAKVVGSDLASECSVTVITDPPVVSVTADQSIAFGGEAAFTVSVAQAYGTVVDIKADMDGDGVFEETVAGKNIAVFKKTYSEAKPVTVKFEVKDSEGNIASATRKVTVGAPGVPLVNIFDPSKDTTLNVLSLKIRFSVKDTSLGMDTTVDSIVTLQEGINSIKAARKNAGGEGSDVVVITADTTKPLVTIASTPASTSTAALTLAGTGSDAGAGIQSIMVSGALAGNGAATFAAGAWSKTGLTLKEGDNTLTATATDKAGNARSVSVNIALDSKKPGVPVVTAPAASRTNLIKWTWTKANGDGSGRFKVKIGTGAEIDVGTALEYTHTALTDNTVYGLSVKETDPVAGDGAWSAAKNVLYDSKSPDPVLTRNAATTNAPKWSWTSNGGTGTFRWHYSGSAAGSAGTGTGLSFTPTNLNSGTHTLCVQEKDSPEWGDVWGKSPETCLGITVDKSGPTITDVLPKPGFITNQDEFTVTYKADGVAGSFVCDLRLDGQANPCEKTVTDAFNNPSSISTSIWRRSNVVFVKENGTGTGGTSWDDALGNLYVALNNSSNSGKEIWVGAGSYTRAGGEWNILGDIDVYGGFTPSTYPNSIASRNTNTNKTKVTGEYFFVGAQQRSDILLDGFNFSGLRLIIEPMSSKITISNSELTGQTACEYGCLLIRGDDVLIDKVKINSLRGIEAAIYIYSLSSSGNGAGGKVRITGGQINENTLSQFGTAAVNIQAGSVTFEGGLNIIGNTSTPYPGAQVYLWGGSNPLTLTVNSGVQIEGGKSSILSTDDGAGNPLACLYYMGEKGAGCP